MMKRALIVAVLLIIAAAAPPLAHQVHKSQVAHMSLKVGDMAPDFTLLTDDWKTVKLSDYRGKKNVFLAVYVLAFSEGCTQQMRAVQAGIDYWRDLDVQYGGCNVNNREAATSTWHFADNPDWQLVFAGKPGP